MPAKARRIRVLVVDERTTFAQALKIALDLERDLRVVGVAGDGDRAASLAAERRADVVLMEIRMPGTDGIEATRKVKAAAPDARVVILSDRPDELLVARALEAGASGYLSKQSDVADVAQAVRRAFRGQPLLKPEEVHRLLRRLRHRREEHATGRERADRLTPREVEILQHMANGFSSDQIAKILGLSPHTLRTHIQNILTKLRVHSKVEALAFAIRHGKVSARP